jgi:thioredoxin reductase (NADPH)
LSTLDTRRDQMFPTLNAVQIATARRFASGESRVFEPGQVVFETGERGAPMWLVLEGQIDAVRRDGRGVENLIAHETAGQFSGEVAQLSGRPALATGRAGPAGVTALPFDAAHLRALVIGSADIGEVMMRALILRRVALIEEGGAGAIIIGRPDAPEVVRLHSFIAANGYPVTVLDAEKPDEGHELVERLALGPDDLPVVLCPSGSIVRRPTEAEVATCLGIAPELDLTRTYDVAVVGAGPAGLATCVYAASEGLSVLAFDQRAVGGQAGASARIENYLGFPTGISGRALAGRAWTQAQKFGAEMAVPCEVTRLICDDADPEADLKLELSIGGVIKARTVVVASGARYRRPPIANLERFEGAGVSYWASPIEARLCAGEEVALIGGGNSAGQAVVFLAPQVKRLHLIVRREGLEATMSKYLIDRIEALPNVELYTHSELIALDGEEALQGALFRNRLTGEEAHHRLHHLFVFIGADPNSEWLKGCVKLDAKGFVITGADAAEPGAPEPLPLETSRRRVFAIGDIRCGSTKRVAAGVGEGAAVVSQIHGAWRPCNRPRARRPAPELRRSWPSSLAAGGARWRRSAGR